MLELVERFTAPAADCRPARQFQIAGRIVEEVIMIARNSVSGWEREGRVQIRLVVAMSQGVDMPSLASFSPRRTMLKSK